MSALVGHAGPAPEMRAGWAGPGQSSLRVLERLVRKVTQSDDLVVIETVPGGGPLAAAAIDRARIAPIVGTVARDDTVVASARSALSARVVARYLRSVASGAATEGGRR
ncbi:hypothetical protein V5H98_01460 [Georgenia sp. M64]|jgi:transcriptional regulator of arginine metabolism|uniref:hypothetical protein n=1 Tax=Georgenia sp. M64 TaxID=3120520 RepID=UPI0030E2A2FB